MCTYYTYIVATNANTWRSKRIKDAIFFSLSLRLIPFHFKPVVYIIVSDNDWIHYSVLILLFFHSPHIQLIFSRSARQNCGGLASSFFPSKIKHSWIGVWFSRSHMHLCCAVCVCLLLIDISIHLYDAISFSLLMLK